MRLFPIAFLTVLAGLPLSSADLQIDHVTIAGRDLKALQAGLRAVGIPTVYGGAHGNSVTEMAAASFPDGSYLEAIALQPGANPQEVEKHEWARFLKTAGMPAAWALRAGDLNADTARLRAAGVELSAPVRAGRKRPDGVQLEWETVGLGAETRGTFFPFLIHDLTNRDLRAFAHGKPPAGDFSGVARVVVAVRNLKEAEARYRRAFGLPEASEESDTRFGARLAAFRNEPVVLAQPLGSGSWIAMRLQDFGEGPCAFILAAARGRAVAVSNTRWFGRPVFWFDAGKLGWRLGFE
jgi:catechol 2,3-dioxygenase-like lactoylglutathione lyase family enzyme